MGAINYFTSDYITIGIIPYDIENYEDEAGNIDYEEMNFDYDYDFENVNNILKKYDFYFYHVTIKPGYYEGFSIDIENNFSVAFDSWEDKREAQKELTLLKKCLVECAGVGLVQCFPGWCTSYNDYNGTIKAIEKAIKEMREEVRYTPTWKQYNKG